MADNDNRSRKERRLAQQLNDPKRVAREQARRDKERREAGREKPREDDS